MKLFLSTEIPFLPTYLMHEEQNKTKQGDHKNVGKKKQTAREMWTLLHSLKKKHTPKQEWYRSE
jgi:hypothetical protein